MELKIEIPEWAKERTLYVLAGRELLAIKRQNGKLKIKTVRCNNCAACCKDVPEDWFLGYKIKKGIRVCRYLGDKVPVKNLCLLGIHAPLICVVADPSPDSPDPIKECCVRFKEVK